MPTSSSKPKPSALAPYFALLLLAVIWGYNWVVMKLALQHATAAQFASMRTVGGGLLLLLIMALMRKPLRPQQLASTISIGLLQTSGFTGLIIWALVQGAAGKTSVLSFTMPFWVMLMAWPILGERIRGMQWLAVLFSLVGLLLILEPWHLTGSLSSMLLAVGAGICWALSIILAKKLHARVPKLDLMGFTAWQMLLGSLPIVVMALFEHAPAIHWDTEFVLVILFSVVLANALGWMLWLYALKYLPAGIASMSSLLIPCIGVFSAWLQLGERPQTLEMFGMGCIILALLVISLVNTLRQTKIDPAMGQD